MDLAELGVSIDPKPAVDGANQIVSALQLMGTAAEAMAASIERSALRTQNAFLGLSGDGLTALRTEIQNIATRLGEATAGIERSADRLNAALAGISLPANNAVSSGFTDMATAANSSAASIERSAQQTTQALTSIGASGIDQTTEKITTMATSAQGAASTIQRSANDAQTALASIGGTATRDVTTGLDNIASSATTAANTLERTSKEAQIGLQAMVTNGTKPVQTALVELQGTTENTGTNMAALAAKSQAAFDSMAASAKTAGAAVTQAQEGVRRRSWETGSSLERQGAQAQTGFNTMAAAARTAGTTVTQAQEGIRRRSWETGDAIQRQAQQAQTGFAAIATAARNAASGFAGFAASLGAVIKQVVLVTAVIGAMIAVIGTVAAIVLPLTIAIKATTAAFGLLKESLSAASQFETLKMQFANMLGSMEAAEERVQSLRRVMEGSTFGIDQISSASMTLETLTRGLYSNERALIAVGNAAAKQGKGIEEVAQQIGNLFFSIQSGADLDAPLKGLIKQRIFEPEVYAQITAMQKGGADIRSIWAVVTAQLEKADGAMANMTKTFNGAVNGMKYAWLSFKLLLGEAITPAATDAINLVTEGIKKMTTFVEESQTKIESMANTVAAVMRVILEPGGFTLAMRAATDTFTKAMDEGFTATADKILKWIKETFGVDLKAAFNDIRNADIWNVLETEIIPKIGTALANAITKGILEGLAGVGDTLSGGLTTALGTSGGTAYGAAQARRASSPSLISDLPSGPAGQFMQSRRMVEEVGTQIPLLPSTSGAPFDVNDTLPPGYVPSDGASGAQLLPALNENARATDSLAQIINDVRRPQPEGDQFGGAVNLLGSIPTDYQSPSLRGTPAQQEFQRQLQRAEKEGQQRQADIRESIKLNPPQSSRWERQILSEPKEAKAARAPKRDPMEIEAERITSQMRNPEEVYKDTVENLQKLRDKFADTGKFTTDTFNRAMLKAKDDYTSAVKAMEAAAKAAAEANMTELQKLGAQWTDVAKMVDQANVQIAQSMQQNLTTAFVSIIDGSASAGEAFSRLADQMVADLLRIITQMMVAKAIGTAIGFFTGNPLAGQGVTAALSPGGLGGGGGLFGGRGATAAVAHDGGVVGETTRSRVTNPAIFRSAPRYHEGGMVGLQPGEEPIIAQKGEVITTEDQERMRARLRGDNKQAKQQIAVTNVNVVDATMIDEHLTKNPDALINVISRNKTRVKQILSING
jgi:hypothetical protein